jgi:Uma2 family endonuclease
MATLPTSQPPSTVAPPALDPLWRMTVEQYHAMIDTGILDEDSPVELLEGVLLEKMPKNPRHVAATGAVRTALAQRVPTGWYVRSQDPITLSSSESEPDITVVRGQPSDFRLRHPGPADVALVVEVADSSISRDRSLKSRVYARAGIPVYWLLDLNSNTLEVRTQPDGDGYRSVTVFHPADEVPVVPASDPARSIPVSTLLP